MNKWEEVSETDEYIMLRRKIWCYRSICDHKDFDTESEAQEYKAKMGNEGTIESTFLEKRVNKDNNGEYKEHNSCKHREREERDGVTMDWCYAIGCCEVGDMPCEYCVDHPERYKKQ